MFTEQLACQTQLGQHCISTSVCSLPFSASCHPSLSWSPCERLSSWHQPSLSTSLWGSWCSRQHPWCLPCVTRAPYRATGRVTLPPLPWWWQSFSRSSPVWGSSSKITVSFMVLPSSLRFKYLFLKAPQEWSLTGVLRKSFTSVSWWLYWEMIVNALWNSM